MINDQQQSNARTKRYVYAVTLLLIALVGAERLYLRPTGAVASEYHRAIRERADEIPISFAEWVGVDVPVPEAAVRMLHPNVIISRAYQNLQTGERVSFLFVHVSDARDILGHYPPVCYPAQGWTLAESESGEWSSERNKAVGTRYEFRKERYDANSTLSVLNILMLPDNVTCRTMDEMQRFAQGRQRKFFGAGQIQLVSEQRMSPEREAEVVSQFLNVLAPIMAIRSVQGAADVE